jgi:hypothetical protein
MYWWDYIPQYPIPSAIIIIAIGIAMVYLCIRARKAKQNEGKGEF